MNWISVNVFVLFVFLRETVDSDIEVKLDDVSTCVGNNVPLAWRFGSESAMDQVTWSHGNNSIMYKVGAGQATALPGYTNIQHDVNGGITIKNVSLADEGNYSITVSYSLSSDMGTVTDSVMVAVKSPPSLPSYTVSGSGAQTSYNCFTTNLGTPEVITRIKIGEDLQQSSSVIVDFQKKVDCCVIGEAVSCIDQKNEFCVNAITPNGPDDMQLEPNATEYTLKVGETLGPVLCSAKCTPTCTYDWRKGHRHLTTTGTLSIIVKSKDDRGIYSCTATRGLFISDTRNITLFIRYGPDQINFRPQSHTHTGTETETLSITCISDCYPGCNYTWTKQGESQIISPTNVLYFKSLDRGQRGQYVCRVTNYIADVSNPASDTISIFVRYGPDQINFRPQGHTHTGTETKNLSVTCISDCYPGCNYTWTKQGESLTISQSDVLQFNSLDRGQRGQYVCIVTNKINGVSNPVSDTISIFVRYGPNSTILSPPKTSYTVNSGTKLHDIHCTSECYPVCSHIWIKQGVTSKVVAENGVLQLGVLAKENVGNYTCTANNSKLSNTKTAQIEMYIRYGPDNISITPSGRTHTTEEGNILPNFTCSSECYPGCSQLWNSVTAAVKLTSGNVLSLGIANRNFTGEYSCTSTNEAQQFHKSLNQTVFITVQYHPDVTVSQINGTSVTEGSQNIMLICAAKGDPDNYTFTEWIHYAPDGSTEIRKLNVSLADNGKAYLKFPNTTYMDSGTYKCGVTNGIQNFTTKDQFAYAEATQIVKGRPVLTEWKKNVVSDTHENASLLVTYYSNDESIPIVKWYRTENDTVQERHANDDKMFFENRDENVTVEFYTEKVVLPGYKTVLFIQNVSQSDIGYYNVSVTNSVGTTVLTIHLNAHGVPDSPNMFFIVQDSVTLSSVILTWICGFHGGADQTFYIQYNTSSSPWQTKASVAGGKLENTRFNATIDQLSAETQYFFRIFAANEYGNSSFSKTLTATTETAAEDPPTPSNVGLIAGAAAGGAGLAAIIVVLVLWFLRRRQDYMKSPSKRLLKESERPTSSNGADATPEINFNPMYESAGPPPSAPNNSDVYSQVDKNRKKAKPVGNIYSQVDKTKKRQNSDGSEVKNDVYAQVQKQTQKRRDAGKTKHKKQKPDKRNKKGKQAEGDLYDNVDTMNSTATKEDAVYENPTCSIEDDDPKQIRNPDGLIYADLDLPQEAVGKNTKAIIHGLDDRTDYADIKYGAVGEQASESDEESTKKD